MAPSTPLHRASIRCRCLCDRRWAWIDVIALAYIAWYHTSTHLLSSPLSWEFCTSSGRCVVGSRRSFTKQWTLFLEFGWLFIPQKNRTNKILRMTCSNALLSLVQVTNLCYFDGDLHLSIFLEMTIDDMNLINLLILRLLTNWLVFFCHLGPKKTNHSCWSSFQVGWKWLNHFKSFYI